MQQFWWMDEWNQLPPNSPGHRSVFFSLFHFLSGFGMHILRTRTIQCNFILFLFILTVLYTWHYCMAFFFTFVVSTCIKLWNNVGRNDEIALKHFKQLKIVAGTLKHTIDAIYIYRYMFCISLRVDGIECDVFAEACKDLNFK